MILDISIATIIATTLNIALLIAVIFLIYKFIRIIRNFINKHNELDKKVDAILNKLDNKNNNSI
ncbi:carboxymuconolactone decarboxylase [Clostridium tertium]|uniref:Uncharacterized protein n=1 Tax=Clostridium tertium TaxID=1559 RepID=A0A6N3FBS4_9CLOT